MGKKAESFDMDVDYDDENDGYYYPELDTDDEDYLDEDGIEYDEEELQELDGNLQYVDPEDFEED